MTAINRYQPDTLLALVALSLSIPFVYGCTTKIHVKEPSVLGALNRSGIEPVEAAYLASSRYDPDKRSLGTRLLAATSFGGATAYLNLYREQLKDNDVTVRVTAIRALARHGRLEDGQRLSKMLEDGNGWARHEAALALQRFHYPDSKIALQAACLKDEDMDVRLAATQALGQYPGQDQFQTLIAALDDNEYSVRLAAGHALCIMTNESFRAEHLDSRFWLKWLNENPMTQTKTSEAAQAYQWTDFPRLPSFWKKLLGGFTDQYLTLEKQYNRPDWFYYPPVSPANQTSYQSPDAMIRENDISFWEMLLRISGNIVIQALRDEVQEHDPELLENMIEPDDI